MFVKESDVCGPNMKMCVCRANRSCVRRKKRRVTCVCECVITDRVHSDARQIEKETNMYARKDVKRVSNGAWTTYILLE